MKFKIFLFYISFRLIFSQFLDVNLTSDLISRSGFENIYPYFFTKSANELLNVYYVESDSRLNKKYHFIQIDIEKDEITKKELLDKNILYHKQLEDDINVYISNANFGEVFFTKDEEIIFAKNISISSLDFYATHKDKLFILFDGHISHRDYYPKIYTFKYPYTSLDQEIIINYWNYRFRRIITLKDALILYYDPDNYSNVTSTFVILDSDFNILNIKNITIEDNSYIIRKKFSEFSETELYNEFIFCVLHSTQYFNKSICKIIKYENSDLTFGENFVLFQNLSFEYESWLDNVYIYPFKDNNINKILFVCRNSQHIVSRKYTYLFSLAKYEEGKLEFDKNIGQYNYTFEQLYINDLSKVQVNKNGIGIYYIYYHIGKYYLNSVCYSTRIYLRPNKLLSFPAKEIFFKGLDYSSFYFTKIDKHLELYRSKVKLKENDVFDNLNDITYFFKIENPEKYLNDIFYLKAGMQPKEIYCNVEIEILVDFIDINKNLHKCVLNETFKSIHNISNNNFNTTFKITKKTKYIEIYYKFVSFTPKDNELIIYYNKIPINCQKKDLYTATCKIPINILKLYHKCDFYSKLSCKNEIYLGWIIITDDYIIQAYDLNPKTLPFKKIRKIYDASKPITEFSSNMINYFYWFSCFAYCDDEVIARNKCCSNILDEWELVEHKEYTFPFSKYNFYIYNYVILKNDKYKKIIVAFPGTESYAQLLNEIIYSNLIGISKGYFTEYKVSNFFYQTFEFIKEDLLKKLSSLSGVRNDEYQIIFTGHSLGGALATISSFHCVLNSLLVSEPILITFGQPRVGDEKFAKYMTSNIKQIYRIARLKDIVTLVPLNEDSFEELVQLIASSNKYKIIASRHLSLLIIGYALHDLLKDNSHYSHTGGLYMIKDSKPDNKYENKIYHCVDFFNDNTGHSICKNHELKNINSPENHNYIILDKDDILTGCQNKKMNIFQRNVSTGKKKKEKKKTKNTNKLLYYRKLSNNQEEIKLESNKEFYLGNNISQILLQYEIKENVNFKENILVLKIDGKNSMFFGEVCYSLNLNSILNEDYDNDDKIICYNIYTNKAITININLEKNSNENILYFYLKGKISGYIELLDFSKKKFLDINSPYYIPQIDDINSEKNIILSIEEIKENINLNIMLNNNNCSVFEIYENNQKIECNDELPNIIILKKKNNYEFKYYPYNNNELIVNFISPNPNEFLYKTFYSLDSQNFYINYNINNNEKNISSLFFDIKGKIKIEAYFSNETNFDNDLDEYDIITDKNYFYVNNDYNTNYINIRFNIYYTDSNDFIINEVDEVIEVFELNSKYNISKGKNILFDLSSDKSKFSQFESYILLILNNPNNYFKLITSDYNIITSNNYLLEMSSNIEGVFILVNEDDIFEIKLIPEKIGKYIDFNLPTTNWNIFTQNKEWVIEYIYPTDSDILFYENNNDINNDMEIYQLDLNSKFNLDHFINKKFDNYKNISFGKIIELEPYNSYIFLKRCKNQCIYTKYGNQIYEFEHSLEESKIIYLFKDFEYNINYNESIRKIKIKKLNNYNTIIEVYCQDIIIQISNNEQIINVEKCKGEFSIKGNNSLIYLYIPVSLNDDIASFKKIKSFTLNNINEFIFIPNENQLNSINLLFTNPNYLSNSKSISFLYFINHNTVPYSRIISRHYIELKESIGISLPNYKQNNINNEEYFIYFIFLEIISNIEVTVNYENIISLPESDNSMIIPSGTNIIQLEKLQDYYINIITDDSTYSKKNIKYTIIRNGIINEEEKDITLDSDTIYFNRTSNDKNIKIKVEGNENMFVAISSESFDDFSMITYDKSILVNQIENILNIKFNTTEYESNIEYNIAIIEDNNINIRNMQSLSHYSYHEITNNNDSLINLLYSSAGIEPISIELNVDEYFSDNTSCIILVLGKQNFEGSYNYLYYDPIQFNIIKNKIEIETEIEKGKEKEKDIETEVEKEKEKEEKKSSSYTGIVLGIFFGLIIIIGVIAAGIYFYRRRKSNFHTLPNLNNKI